MTSVGGVGGGSSLGGFSSHGSYSASAGAKKTGPTFSGHQAETTHKIRAPKSNNNYGATQNVPGFNGAQATGANPFNERVRFNVIA